MIEAKDFWANTRQNKECWDWNGATFTDGYGAVSWRGVLRRAHRVAWEIANGPIAKGLLVCHHCDNPKCVRPEHLFLGTIQDNTHDMIQKGRAAWQSVVVCPKGHPYSPDNTYRSKQGKRYCKMCNRAASSRRYARYQQEAKITGKKVRDLWDPSWRQR